MENTGRSSGIDVIGDVPWGTHFGLFYRTKQDLIDILVPYFEAGLKNNEFCIWVTAGPLDTGEVRACLASAIPDFERYCENGQIEIISHIDWYKADGAFDGGRMLNGWVDKLQSAHDRGFSGLRVAGDESWLEKGEWKDFIDYEQMINDVIGQYHMIALCTYPMDSYDANDVLDVVSTHQFVLSKRNGKWELIEDQGQKNARKALRETEQRYRAIIETAGEGIWVLDNEAVTVSANNRMAEMLGYTVEELIGKNAHDFVYEEDIEKGNSIALKNIKDGSGRFEFKYRKKDGSPFWTIVSSKHLFDDHGKHTGSFAMFTDITERKRAEDALWESELKFRQMAENINSVFWISDTDGSNVWRYAYMSPAFERIFGIPVERVYDYPQLWLKAIYFEDRERFQAAMSERAGGDYFNVDVPEFRIVRPDGTMRWIKARVYPIKEEGDAVRRFVGIADDITERKQAEDALKSSELKFRTLFENASSAIFIADVETGNILDCNSNAEQLLGRYRNEIIGMHQTGLHPPENAGINRENFQRHSRLDRVTNYETEVLHKNGRRIPVILSAVPVVINGRKVMMGSFFDITERKRAEEALKVSEEKFRVLAETSYALIFVHRGSRFLYINNMAGNITGYSRDELFNMNFWDLVHPDCVEMVKSRASARLHEEDVPSNYEIKIITRDGKIRWVHLAAGLIVYQGAPAVIATLFDITERKQAEEELKATKAQAELYLDLMGHDINNMHQIALGYLELARDMHTGADEGGFLDTPIEVLQRSAQLIRNVNKLQKLHDGVFQTIEVDLCKVLGDVQREFGAVPHKAITLNLNECEHCPVRANELLYDVLVNLVSNAIKHTGDHADIVIDLNNVKDNEGRYCRVMVEDNGPGIPDDFKGRIFNRMLKGDTKSKGIGLGLYLVKSLVESYGGRVWVEDRVQGDHTKGARFVVMLPAIEN